MAVLRGLRCASTLMRSPLTTMLVAVDLHRAGKLAVHRVVAGQMRVGLRIAEIVDRDDLDVVFLAAFVVCTKDVAADAAITIDCNFDRHIVLPAVLKRLRLEDLPHGLHDVFGGESEIFE